MDQNQTTPPIPPTPSNTYAARPASVGIFGTRMPSAIAFAVAALLFLLPFAEIKCSGQTLASNTGMGIAMKKEWKVMDMNLGDQKSSNSDNSLGNSWMYAAIALGLALLAFLLSFASAKAGGGGGIVLGILSAGSLIAMMITMKNEFGKKTFGDATETAEKGSDVLGMDKLGDSINSIKPSLAFTPFFYITIVALLVGAFFCYKRMQSSKI